MKKYFSILFCVIFILSLIGCGKPEKTNAAVNSQPSSAASGEQSSSTVTSSEASSTTNSSEPSLETTSAKQSGNTDLTTFTEGKITFKLPNNYKKKGESPILYVPSDYPKTSDNFNIAIAAKDPNFKKLTKETYQKQLESMFSSVKISVFEPTSVSGFDALKIRYSLKYNGVALEQVQYAVDSDQTYVFTYAFINGDLKNYVDDCAASITINK